MKLLFSVTLFAVGVSLAVAQYSDSPAPPRLHIPGAVPLPGQGGAPAYRTGPVLVRTRRPLIKGRLQHSQQQPSPVASPVPIAPRAEFEAKPVTEEIEEPTQVVQGPFASPQLSVGPSSPAPHARAPQPKLVPQPKFFEPNPLGEDDAPILTRFQPQERPTAVPVQIARFQQQGQQAPQKNLHRPTAAYRAHDQDDEQRHRQQVVRPTPRYNNHNDRERKPVAQILRKYREEHEDGTITWGFENDDGSYKEETIGIDCVTRGRYGYVDPDGEKREYTYETGILCDPNKRDEEEQEEEVNEPEFVPHVKHFKRPQPQFKHQ